uniref:glutathione S-transferase 1-like n=1 Tax=Styela clava TaxID=7725 RepID=UPI001939B74A|nr:glutathione S-transferase 1-like [Styela clava]
MKFYYHPQSPACQPVWMVLKELGIEYEAIELNLWSGNVDKDELFSVNPYGKVPALKDGNICLGESRAVSIYLCSKYEAADKDKPLYPKDVDSIARINMELFADLDSIVAVQKYLNIGAVFSGKAKGPCNEHFPEVKKHIDHMEKVLSNQSYLAGNHLTILDFCKLNLLGMLDMAGYTEWVEYPKIVEWRDRMSKLSYYEECHAAGFKANRQIYTAGNAKYDELEKK